MNKILLQIADLSWAKVFLGILVVTALYYFGIRDDGSTLQTNLEQAHQELEAAQKQLQVVKKAMENAQRFELEVKAAKKQFERVTEFMPPRLNIADLTTLMSDKSSKAGVRLLNTSPNSARDASDKTSTVFDSIRVGFTIEGTFAQILSFLSQVSRDSRMVTFDTTVLATAGGMEGDSPLLTFGGDLVGYRYKPLPVKVESPAPAAAPAPANAGGNNAQ